MMAEVPAGEGGEEIGASPRTHGRNFPYTK